MFPGYRVLETLHEGHNSVVFRGERVDDKRRVILKRLAEDYPSPQRIASFRQEYEINTKVSSDVDLCSLQRQGNHWLMVLADSGGISLDRVGLRGTLTILEYLRLALKIVESVGKVHRHLIIHRDINPANITLSEETGAVELIDFGTSTLLPRASASFSNPSVLEGTLPYIAPEQTGRMNRTVDLRADLYSLGVTLYELLTGTLPFTTEDPLELVHCHVAKLPPDPRESRSDTPATIAAILLKLLAKSAEERYQSTHGLAHDLRRCLELASDDAPIVVEPLGSRDVSDRLHIPETLYGRERELQSTLTAFERVCEGSCELVIVSGAPGIGKSALVRELYGPITRRRGFFIAGKFDQFNRSTPYSSLIQAFRSLTRLLLAEPPERVAAWRSKIIDALGPNGTVLIRVIPELELIIGPQPNVPELRPEDAHNRFNLIIRAFIGVFTAAEHPLVIFLDDLQWADHATLDLLEVVLCASTTSHLLVVSAHRNNEVDVSHPLIMTLERIRRRSVPITEVELTPLMPAHVVALLGDALHSSDDEVRPLAELLNAKTGGNPFFVGEFLRHLHDDGLVVLDAQRGRWSWDLDQIRQRNITANVVELMSQKVRELAPEVQATLKIASALGSPLSLESLVKTAEQPLKTVIGAIWTALQSGFMTPLGESVALLNLELESDADTLPNFEVRFTHDRIQQAIYALIPEDERPVVHRRIGHHLLDSVAIDRLARGVFTIVGHLNQARVLVEGWEERHVLARLNLRAAERAYQASAFSAAYEYFKIGSESLSDEGWARDHALTFTLNLGAAESACMVGSYDDMQQRTAKLMERATDTLERARVQEILIQAKTIQLDLPGALHLARVLLRDLGVRLPARPRKLDVIAGVLRMRATLAGKNFHSFAELPQASDPKVLAQSEIMGGVISAAYRSNPNSFILIALAMLKLSVRHGNTPASGFAYACYALILAGAIGDIPSAKRMVPLCEEMLDWPSTRPFKAKTLFALGSFVLSWTDHFSVCAQRLYDGYVSGLEVGDLEFASHCGYIRSYYLLRTADNLADLKLDLEQMADALTPLGQGRAAELCELYVQVASNLCGEAQKPRLLVSERFDVNASLRESYRLSDTRAIVEALVQKTFIELLFGDMKAARETADRIPEHLEDLPGFPPACESRFLDALVTLDQVPELRGWAKRRALARAKASLAKLRKWARSTPMNYLHMRLLVEAELARVEGRDGDARRSYDLALAAATDHRLLRDQGMIAEFAAAFYFAGGYQDLGRHFIRMAHRAYLRWGAIAKTHALERVHPQLAAKASASISRSATINATVALSSTLDLTSVLRASQAISREIVPEKLLEALIKMVIESAGADRGLLLQSRDDAWTVTVEGRAMGEGLEVKLGLPASRDRLPLSILNYVMRTREAVLRDASDNADTFDTDPYLLERSIRSILCMPLVNQSRLVGILYLENSLSEGAFYEARFSFLEMLASQMATSLENSDLFANLERKVESRTAELRDANDQLTASNHELDAFARTVAHDLKNPLGTIEGYARYLLDDIDDIGTEETVDVLERIALTGDQSVRIVNEILLLASVRKGAVQMMPINMGPVIDGALGRLDAMTKEYGAVIQRQESWPRALGHAPWVEEIWANYISNALKYGGRPPIVELGSDVLEDRSIRFWVRDNGPGITEEEQRQVFAEFTRLEGARADGHGLGLSIVKRIADRLDGQIELSSELGVGSVFSFTLPAPDDDDTVEI